MIGKYSVIYADPPWRYAQKGLQGAAEKHYPTMGIDELCTLPVADLAAPDSVLFLWATFPQLPEALRLIKAWGFTYKSVAFVWLKKNRKSEGWFYGLGFLCVLESVPECHLPDGRRATNPGEYGTHGAQPNSRSKHGLCSYREELHPLPAE